MGHISHFEMGYLLQFPINKGWRGEGAYQEGFAHKYSKPKSLIVPSNNFRFLHIAYFRAGVYTGELLVGYLQHLKLYV